MDALDRVGVSWARKAPFPVLSALLVAERLLAITEPLRRERAWVPISKMETELLVVLDQAIGLDPVSHLLGLTRKILGRAVDGELVRGKDRRVIRRFLRTANLGERT